MTKSESFTATPASDDPLDWPPENYLWVCRGAGRFTLIDGDRLYDLRGGATPETPTEELLAGNSEWLRVYLAHCLGVWPITIPEAGPLPEWDAAWLRAVGETDEELPAEEAAALRRLTDPALAWEIDDGETAGKDQIVILRIAGLVNGKASDFDGMFVVDYDPTTLPDGITSRKLEVTNDPSKARRFSSAAEAMEFYRQVSPNEPARYWDGRPNRPLTAFNVVVWPVLV